MYCFAGSIPNARCNSLCLYGKGATEPPANAEIVPNAKTSRYFEAIFHPGAAIDNNIKLQYPNCTTFITTYKWKRAVLAMRNYVVPPGTLIHTPEIVRLRDLVVIRPSEKVVAGPASTANRERQTHRTSYITIFLAIIAMASMNSALLDITLAANAIIASIGLVLGHALYSLGYLAGKRQLRVLGREFTHGVMNRFVLATLDQGTKASQPSPLHTYFFMQYDTTVEPGAALRIQGLINSTYQKYWSIVVYDEYGLPLPQYVYDDNIAPWVKPLSAKEYSYDVRLVNGVDASSSSSSASSSATGGAPVEIDVSASPKGYVLLRLVHPTNPTVVNQYSEPKVSVLK